MNHQALAEKVVDLALGALSPREAREVEAHVAGCASCAAELASLRETRQAMATLPPLSAPERGEAVLLAAARQAAEQASSRRGLLPRWLWGAAFGAVSVAAAVLVTLQLSGAPPPSRFEEEREALLGRQPAGVAAAPERPAAKAAASPAPAPEPSRVRPAAEQGGLAEAPRPAGERFARAEPAAPPPPAGAGAASENVSASGDAARDRAEIGVGSAGAASRPMADAAPAPAAALPGPSQASRREAEVAGASADARARERAEPRAEPRAEAAAELAAPVPSPARRAKAPLAEAKAAAPRAASAPQAAAAPAPSADLARGATPSERLTFPACPGERSRSMTRDAAGRLLRRERVGSLGGVEYRAEERFGADGRLSGATLLLGRREVALGAAELADAGLEPYPGLRLAATAAEAEAAPPACDR